MIWEHDHYVLCNVCLQIICFKSLSIRVIRILRILNRPLSIVVFHVSTTCLVTLVLNPICFNSDLFQWYISLNIYLQHLGMWHFCLLQFLVVLRCVRCTVLGVWADLFFSFQLLPFEGCPLTFLGGAFFVVFKGPVLWTAKRLATGLDWTD